jgi:uncharacterized protein YndB with AHSA1/START domain
MAKLRCESTVTIARPPAEVFPWLIDADKAGRWVSGLEVYQPLDGEPLRLGSRIREELIVSGHRLSFEMRVTRLEPPREAELAFEGSGFRAVNHYVVGDADGRAHVRWAIGGETTSFSARMLAPMVQTRLQEKLEGDLARLRALLEREAEAA